MPEGNEIHRWAERHNTAFAGKKLRVESPNGRFPDATALDNQKLERVMAKGKHLGYVFGKDRILHVHLGRYGDWTEGQMPLADPKGALRLRMWPIGAKPRKDAVTPTKRHGWYSSDDGTSSLAPTGIDWLELRGAAACELWTDAEWQALLNRLGPDALDGDDPKPAFDRILNAKTPISVLLMDQCSRASATSIVQSCYTVHASIRSPKAAGSRCRPSRRSGRTRFRCCAPAWSTAAS